MFKRFKALYSLLRLIRMSTHKVLAFIGCVISLSAHSGVDISAGKTIYDSACMACHAKDLSGATGFNLRDGIWVHGGSKEQIFNTISRGVQTKGMPAFASVYSAQDLQNVVAYIQSKQVGFRALNYKIFHIEESKHTNLDAINSLTPVKQGASPDALANFALPEVKQYAIEFSGDFIADQNTETWLHSPVLSPDAQVRVYINDQLSLSVGKDWQRSWKLKSGKQHLRIQYTTAKSPPESVGWVVRDLIFVVVNAEKTQRLYPVSNSGQRILKESIYKILVIDKPEVTRKKIIDLPANSISVGFVDKLNYAFNTKNCAIVAVWKGDFLDVGPNISQRGKQASLPLADWTFRSPEIIVAKDEPCHFEKYTRYELPEFHYNLGHTAIKIKGQALDSSTLNLHYSTSNLDKSSLGIKTKKRMVKFTLPRSKKVQISSSAGNIDNNVLTINLKKHPEFDIKLTFTEFLK